MKTRQCGMIFLLLLALLLRPKVEVPPSVPEHPPETRWCFRIEETTQTVPHAILRYESDTLSPGETRLLVRGNDGAALRRERITERNGAVVGRELLCQTLTLKPHDTVILIGTSRESESHPSDNEYRSQGQTVYAQDGVLITPSGQELRYSRTLRCIATAYTARPGALTATGSLAREGAIAVDPKVIPYGTAMYIVSEDGEYLYGHATAEDCGAFRGHQIDLYFDTVEACYRFGARSCTVYLLE